MDITAGIGIAPTTATIAITTVTSSGSGANMNGRNGVPLNGANDSGVNMNGGNTCVTIAAAIAMAIVLQPTSITALGASTR